MTNTSKNERASDVLISADFPADCHVTRLSPGYYRIRTPWGVGFRIGAIGLMLDSSCCQAHYNRLRGDTLTCSKCGGQAPIASDFGDIATWNVAQEWLETLLGAYGADVLTAAVRASTLLSAQERVQSDAKMGS